MIKPSFELYLTYFRKKVEMRLIALILGISLMAIGKSSYCQLEIAPNTSYLKKLSESTLIYAARGYEIDRIPELQKAFSEAWTYSKIKVIKPEELEDYSGVEGYSFLTLKFTQYLSPVDDKTPFTSSLSLNLWIPSKNEPDNKNQKVRDITFATIKLYPSSETLTKFYNLSREKTFNYSYSDSSVFYNWHPGFIKNDLRVINDYLNQKKSKSYYGNLREEAVIGKLKQGILYIPDYSLLTVTSFRPAEKQDAITLLEKYKGRYKILPTKELSEMLLATNEEIFYVMNTFLSGGNSMLFTLYGNKTGEEFYRKYLSATYKLKPKHFKEIIK